MFLRRDLAKTTSVPEVKCLATCDCSSFRLVCVGLGSKAWAWAWFCWDLKADFPLEARAPCQDFHPTPWRVAFHSLGSSTACRVLHPSVERGGCRFWVLKQAQHALTPRSMGLRGGDQGGVNALASIWVWFLVWFIKVCFWSLPKHIPDQLHLSSQYKTQALNCPVK